LFITFAKEYLDDNGACCKPFILIIVLENDIYCVNHVMFSSKCLTIPIKKLRLPDITLLKSVMPRLYRRAILHVICTIGLEFGAGDLDRQTKLS